LLLHTLAGRANTSARPIPRLRRNADWPGGPRRGYGAGRAFGFRISARCCRNSPPDHRYAACCARTTAGHATAPPSPATNSRRLMGDR